MTVLNSNFVRYLIWSLCLFALALLLLSPQEGIWTPFVYGDF